MQKMFDNKEIKNIVSLILPIAIGLLGSAMGNWNYQTDAKFKVKLFFLVIFIIIFVIFLILSYIYDRKEKKRVKGIEEEIQRLNIQIGKIEKLNRIYEKSQLHMATILEQSADDINATANNIARDKSISFEIWNFKKECKWICEKVLELIEELSDTGSEFAVSIFQISPIKKGRTKEITMIAHSSKYGNTPDVYESALSFKKNAEFYAVKLFKKNKHEPTVLIDKNEVNEKFVYKDENNHPNYSQYIAIPIHCSGNDMLSLLQIVAFENSKLGITKTEIIAKINKFIFPYKQLGLMTYKCEKSLLNSGYLVEKLKGAASNE